MTSMIPRLFFNKKQEKQSYTLTVSSFVSKVDFLEQPWPVKGRNQSNMEMNETQHTSCRKSKGVNNLPAADTVPFPTENSSNTSQKRISTKL